MKFIISPTILIFSIFQLSAQTEATLSFGRLSYKLAVDDSGNGYGGTFNEHSKNTFWGSIKVLPWGNRLPFVFELRLKHKTGSMYTRYGGQAHPRSTGFEYEQFRFSAEARYKFRLFRLKSWHAGLGWFADVPAYSKIEGNDDGRLISAGNVNDYIRVFDTGLSAAIEVSHMFNKRFGLSAQVFANQSVRWNWHSQLNPIRDTGIGIGAIWQFKEN